MCSVVGVEDSMGMDRREGEKKINNKRSTLLDLFATRGILGQKKRP